LIAVKSVTGPSIPQLQQLTGTITHCGFEVHEVRSMPPLPAVPLAVPPTPLPLPPRPNAPPIADPASPEL
jgi:hypothetical protein